MSELIRKILVVGASLLMLVSVGTGTFSMNISVHAISQTKLKKTHLSKNHTKKIKRARNHKSHKAIKSYHNRGWKMNHCNKRNSQKATYHGYRNKSHMLLAESNFSRQYKQGFKVSENFDFPPSTYRGFKFQDNEYYNGLHHPMTKVYKKGFLKGAEKEGRAAAFEGHRLPYLLPNI